MSLLDKKIIERRFYDWQYDDRRYLYYRELTIELFADSFRVLDGILGSVTLGILDPCMSFYAYTVSYDPYDQPICKLWDNDIIFKGLVRFGYRNKEDRTVKSLLFYIAFHSCEIFDGLVGLFTIGRYSGWSRLRVFDLVGD